VVLIVNHLSGKRLPRWALPIGVGAAMIAFTIWSEYSWFGRTTAVLPDTIVIASHNESTAPWRPWTYLKPMTNRFIAFERAAIRTHPDAPGQKMVDVLLFGRWAQPFRIPVLYDCQNSRRADLIDGAAFGPDGTVADADWRDLEADDPVLAAVCAEG
jgi:hypothetical protein